MNKVTPLTNVVAFFVPSMMGTEVHLLHTGWRNSSEWDEARQWFKEEWSLSLSKLRDYSGTFSEEQH